MMKRFVCLVLALLALALVLTEPARAELAQDMKIGSWTGEGGHRWLKFGKRFWRVLNVYVDVGGRKTALLLANDTVAERPFDGLFGDWRRSAIKNWLNNEFFNSQFSNEERGAIFNTTDYILGGPNENYGAKNTDSSRIYLLSVEQVRDGRYFLNDKDRVARDDDRGWWLRSPGYDDSLAANVSYGGKVYDTGYRVDYAFGIRPAFLLNLSSSIFTSSSYQVTY